MQERGGHVEKQHTFVSTFRTGLKKIEIQGVPINMGIDT